jgi:uncharacterized UBP type Zn finger protein
MLNLQSQLSSSPSSSDDLLQFQSLLSSLQHSHQQHLLQLSKNLTQNQQEIIQLKASNNTLEVEMAQLHATATAAQFMVLFFDFFFFFAKGWFVLAMFVYEKNRCERKPRWN